MAEPTDREFDSLRTLILTHAGIHLADSKRALLYGRLARRLRELDLETFGDYYRKVREDEVELVQLLDLITTNETHFFREPGHFEFLETVLLPQLVAAANAGERPRTLRVWSAGCSTGEEPYSIAMTLLDRLPPTGWSIEISATDVSTRALKVASDATWSMARASEIDASRLRRYMLRGVGSRAGFIRATPELRALVRVARLNLNKDPIPGQSFDLVFCRNVLIYFHPTNRNRVLARLAESLAPAGVLFVGHAESVQGISDRVRCVRPTIYQRHAAPSPNGNAGAR